MNYSGVKQCGRKFNDLVNEKGTLWDIESGRILFYRYASGSDIIPDIALRITKDWYST